MLNSGPLFSGGILPNLCSVCDCGAAHTRDCSTYFIWQPKGWLATTAREPRGVREKDKEEKGEPK